MKTSSFLLGLVALAPLLGLALSYSTYRQTLMDGIAFALNEHERKNPGHVVTDFSTLAGTNARAWERAERTLETSITNVFLMLAPSNRFSMPAPFDGEIAVVMQAPTLDARYGDQPVRRVISRDKDGIFRSQTVDESSLQAEADKVGYSLPQAEVIREDIPRSVLDWGKPPQLTNGGALDRDLIQPNDSAEITSPSEAQAMSAFHSESVSAETNALVAMSETPSSSLRWWLPVSVFTGVGVISFLLLRARRRT